MARRSAALALLLLVVLALLAPVSAGGARAPPSPAGSAWRRVRLGARAGVPEQRHVRFWQGGVSTAVTQCTPLRDALVRLRDTSPQASETLVAAYDFIRDKITLK